MQSNSCDHNMLQYEGGALLRQDSLDIIYGQNWKRGLCWNRRRGFSGENVKAVKEWTWLLLPLTSDKLSSFVQKYKTMISHCLFVGHLWLFARIFGFSLAGRSEAVTRGCL